MTTPESEEGGVLREWAPMSRFLQQVPLKMWRGIFHEDVKFTCVDADIDCIAIGTSVGVVFWYERSTHVVHQLKAEKSNQPITSVSITSSVEYMVASGDKSGIVTIFRIPKNLPTYCDNQKPERIERYTVDELHTSEISALTWSINGQKLFSGDAKGSVVLTEVDFCMSITRTHEILNEKYKIVQLSFCQREQILVVATELRSVLCHNKKPNWKVIQIGQRERHNLLELGATFCVDNNNKVSVYSCRGGLRLWKADLEGNVQHTIIFKEAVNSCSNPVKLLRPMKKRKKLKNNPCELGKLYYWKDGLYVAHYENNFIVLDPESVTVLASILDAEFDFLTVATTKMEIFLIFGDRNLIRLSYTPDKFNSSIGGYGNIAAAEPVSGLPNFYLNPVVGTRINNEEASNARVKLSATTANIECPASEVTYGTESVSLLKPLGANRDGVPELRTDASRNHLFSAIGQQEFDEIVYSVYKKKKGKNTSLKKKAMMSQSLSNDSMKFPKEREIDKRHSAIIPPTAYPDWSFEDLHKEFKRKESLLDAIFPVLQNADNEDTNDQSQQINNENSVTPITNGTVDDFKKENIVEMEDVENSSNSDLQVPCCNSEHQTNFVPENSSGSVGCNYQEDDAMEINVKEVEEEKNVCNGGIPVGKNFASEPLNIEGVPNHNSNEETHEGSSQFSSTPEDNGLDDVSSVEIVFKDKIDEEIAIISGVASYNLCESMTSSQLSETSDKFKLEENIAQAAVFREHPDGWNEMTCPEKASWIHSFNGGIVMCSPRLRAFVFKDGDWTKLNYKALIIALTADGGLAAKTHCSLAHYTDKNWLGNENWKLLSHDVDWISISEDKKIWFVSRGEIYFLMSNSETVDRFPSNNKLFQKVYPWKEGLLAITNDNKVVWYDGLKWIHVRTPKTGAKHLAIGPNRLFWLIDTANKLYVTNNLAKGKTTWWKVDLGYNESVDVSSITASDDGVYISNAQSASIFFNKTSVIGHRWEKSKVDVKCLQLTAEGVFEDKGCLWLLCTSNELLSISPCLSEFELVDVPCNVVCLASSPQVLWIVSDEGEIYVRQGITNSNPSGTKWSKLNLEQFAHVTQIIHISCGCDVVWACDIRGGVYILVGSPHELGRETSFPFSHAWFKVEGKPIDNNTFTKVYVGPQSYMVWALDSAGNVYVREAIFPDYLVGTGWVHVRGVLASQLSISSETVRALCKEGYFKRLGITQNNFIGDSWHLTAMQLEHLSVSVNEEMYGVSTDHILMSHVEKIFPISEEVFVEKDWTLL